MIPRPVSPHQLVSENWAEIDELAVAGVAAAWAASAAAAHTAEQKTYVDGQAYQSALPEGFEAQVEAIFKVGGMAADLSAWFTRAAQETALSAESLTTVKTTTVSTVEVAEAVIDALEFEIAVLEAAPAGPFGNQALIESLQDQIQTITTEARQTIKGLYDSIYVPAIPPGPGLVPLIHTGPPAGAGSAKSPTGGICATPMGMGREGSRGNGGGQNEGRSPGESAKQGESRTPQESQDAGSGAKDGTQSLGTNQGDWRGGTTGPQQPPMSVPSTGAPSTPGTGMSSVPQMGSGMSAPSAPSHGGLGSPGGLGGGDGGLSSLGSSSGSGLSSGAPMSPTQDFLSGATQGFTQAAPLSAGGASSAATSGGQPFKPAGASPMPAAPAMPSAPSTAATPSVPQQVQAPPMTSAPAAGGVPLAAPPPAGVPSTVQATPSTPPVAPPPATAPPVGGGPAPVTPPAPGVLNLGAKSALLRAVRMGAQAVGEGLQATPEYQSAIALVAALHDPDIGVVCEWACAVFKGRGEEAARFVLASREGLSWTPPGVYMPDGVKLAALDDAVPWSVRRQWRGITPPALVLSHYAKAIGEEPMIVVARRWLGLSSLFSKRTVVVADEQSSIVPPNPLRNPAGRHRLLLASPGGWAQVQAVRDGDVLTRMVDLAAYVGQVHDQTYGVQDIIGADGQVVAGDPLLRCKAVEQIGQPDGEDVWSAVAQNMHYVRGAIMTAPITVPSPLTPDWNVDLTDAERMLRGWEVLWLAQRQPTRDTLADMTYAAVAALDESAVAGVGTIFGAAA